MVSRPERPRSETQREILKAAWKLLEECGASGVRLEDVARRAGVSRQALYLNFGSRAGLLVALVEYIDETGRIREHALRWSAAPTARARLDAFLRWWCGYVPRIRGVASALLAERGHDEAAEAAWRNRMEALHGSARSLVDGLAKEGVLSPEWKPAEAADWLWALISVQVHEALCERGWSERRYADRLGRVVRSVLLA